MAEERSRSFYILVAVGIVVVIVFVLIAATRPRPRTPQPQTALTEEQRAYLANIAVTDARMGAAQNFLGQTAIYMDAQIANQGTRAVSRVELQLEFTDMLGQVILRDRAYPVMPPVNPLKAGERRAFQISFDRLPAEWNQAPPRIAIRSVEF